jgi:hypothetical protein
MLAVFDCQFSICITVSVKTSLADNPHYAQTLALLHWTTFNSPRNYTILDNYNIKHIDLNTVATSDKRNTFNV